MEKGDSEVWPFLTGTVCERKLLRFRNLTLRLPKSLKEKKRYFLLKKPRSSSLADFVNVSSLVSEEVTYMCTNITSAHGGMLSK